MFGFMNARQSKFRLAILFSVLAALLIGGFNLSTASAAGRMLMVSKSSDRSNAQVLNGTTLSGNIYAFVNAPKSTTEITFWFDNGKPVQTEHLPFWDLAGGQTAAANPFNISNLGAGPHKIYYTMIWDGGKSVTNSAYFTVASSAPAPTTTTTVKKPATTTTTVKKPATTTTTTTAKPPVTNNSAPAGNLNSIESSANGVLSLGSGVYNFSNFATGNSGNDGALISKGGINGAGETKSIIEMKAMTSTKAGIIPTTLGTTTNPLSLMEVTGDSPLLSNFTLQGTDQGHLYNGLRISRSNNPKISNVKVVAIPGNSRENPGETFSINDYRTTNSVYSNVEIDGAQVGASGIGFNDSNNSTLNNVSTHDMKFNAGITWWQSNNITVNGLHTFNNVDGLNFERVGGTVNLNDVTFTNNAKHDMNIHSDTGSAVYNIVNPVYDGAKLRIQVQTTYRGVPNTQKRSDIHVIENGKDVTASVVEFYN